MAGVVLNAAIDTQVAKSTTADAATLALAQNASNVVDFITACVNRGVDVLGVGNGLTVKGGLVWFHSPDGKPTGVPTIARVQSALDADAVAALLAALNAKFPP